MASQFKFSAEFAKRVIDAGVTDIEKISDAIHSGWNETAKKIRSKPRPIH
jgi:hypothetical protein